MAKTTCANSRSHDHDQSLTKSSRYTRDPRPSKIILALALLEKGAPVYKLCCSSTSFVLNEAVS